MKLLLARPLRNRYLLVSDFGLLAVAAYVSYVLRLEKLDLGVHWPGFLLFTALALVITPLVFGRAGVYARYWRYASVEELLLLAGAVTTAVVLVGAISLAAVQFLPGDLPLPRSIPLIFLLLALVATAGPRFALRLSARALALKRSNGKDSGAQPQPILIMGAGDAGAMIVRELKSNPHLGLEPVGFLDDDLGKHEVKIHGVPVLGDRHAIADAVKQHQVRQVIIAMPTARGVEIRDIVRICGEAGVQARTLAPAHTRRCSAGVIPGIYELLDGSVSVKQVRDVRIEDLLRREPVRTDVSAVSGMLRGKRVLVTGAGGSIGAELCRQIVRRYNEAFAPCDALQTPVERPEVESAWHLYAVRLNLERLTIDRARFIEELKARNIGTSVHFIPVHLHPYYRDKYGYKPEDFSVAYREYQRLVSLPLNLRMSDQDVEDVIEAVLEIVERYCIR